MYDEIAARQWQEELHRRSCEEYERMGRQPLPMGQLALYWVGAFVVAGKLVSDSLGLTFDQAVWLILAAIAGVAVAVRVLKKNQEQRAFAGFQQEQAERVGFSSMDAYELAARARRERMGPAVHDALVNELVEHSEFADIVSFEERLSNLALRRNVDVSLDNKDFASSSSYSLFAQIKKSLLTGRTYIALRTMGAGLLCGVGMWLGLASLGMADGVFGSILTAPLWGSWALLASFLGFVTAVLTVMINTADHVATHLKQIFSKALQSAFSSVSSATGDRVKLSDLPKVLDRWRESALNVPKEKGMLARVAMMLARSLTKRIQNRVSKSLQKAGSKEDGAFSAGEIEEAIAAGTVGVLAGPFPSQLRFLRFVAQSGLTVLVLCSIAIAWFI